MESNNWRCYPALPEAWVPANAGSHSPAAMRSYGIYRLPYEYLCAESARLVLPWRLRGRTVQLITYGTVQLFYDILLHLNYFCYKYISFLYGNHFFFPMTPRFEPPKSKIISGQSIRPQRHIDIYFIFTTTIYRFFLWESLFFSDDTRFRTTEDQAYKRTVYLLDHSVTWISILFFK